MSRLQGLHILVTRPEPENAKLCTQLQNLGAIAYALPLQTRTPTHAQLPQDNFDGVIAISAFAVQLAGPQLQALSSPLRSASLSSQVKPVVWMAIGKTTAAAFSEFIQQPILTPTPEHSEALLDLPQLQQVENQTWLLIKGEGGRTQIQDTLTQRGAHVQICNLYQRQTSHQYQHALTATQPGWLNCQWALLHNGEALLLLARLWQQHQRELPAVIVPSQRLASLAHQLGFIQCITSPGAQSEQMITALENRL